MYIFDLDGTITDTNGVWLDVDREFLARRGLPHTPEYQRVVERSIYPIAAQFTKAFYHLPESPEDIMAERDASAGRHYRELAPLKPGAEEFLLQCRDEGRPMAVFTACRPACAGRRWTASTSRTCSTVSPLRRKSAWKSATPNVLWS